MKRQMSKTVFVLRVIGAIAMVLSASGVAFVLAYFITSWFSAQTGIRWSGLTAQLVNWLLGAILLILVILFINLLTRPRQRAVWSEIIEALRRIAKGDFNIALDRDEKYHGQFGDFVQTINHMAQELKQVEILRQEFISNVSHEIQSPLTSIRGFASALQNEGLSAEERRQYLAIIETESMRLSKLSDNLLKLSSLESEHQPFEPRSYRLDIQLRNAVLALEPQWLEKELEVELELEETTIVADEQLLSQVWMNLIHNAVKFTPPGGSLKIALDQAGDEVKVRVTDTGSGISPEDQLRIFERFYKGDKSRNRTVAGSGLGLSIVKKILDLHCGAIEVESRLGAGSTFRVTLPATQ